MIKVKNKISIFKVFLIIYLIIVIGYILLGPNGKRHDYNISKQKACYSNIRIVQGAVEMYNMNCSPLMNDLDIGYLRKENFLKELPIAPESSCSYIGKNLENDGSIYCDYHGDLQGITIGSCVNVNDSKVIWNFFDYLGGCFKRIPESFFVGPFMLLNIMFSYLYKNLP